MPLTAVARRSRRSAKGSHESRSAVLQDRDESKQQSRQERGDQRERENDRIDRDLAQSGQCLRTNRQQELERSICDTETECATDQAEQQTLLQQFTRNAPPSRAERRSRRELLLTSLHSHEQQIGDVRAGNQQHDADRSHEDPECVRHVADDILLERCEVGPDSRALEQFLVEPRWGWPCIQPGRQHATHVRVGLLQRHARFEPGHTLIAEVAEEHSIAIESLRKDDVGLSVQELKTVRHDANHRIRFRIDRQRSAESRAVTSESALPVSRHQDDGVGTAGRVVRLRKPAAKGRRDIQRLQRAVRDPNTPHLLRLSHSCDRHAPALPDTHLAERLTVFTVGEVHRRRDVQLWQVDDPRRRVPDADEFIGIGIGQRLDQHAIHDAEHGGIGANANGEGDERDGREPGGARKTPDDRRNRWHMWSNYDNARARFRLTTAATT